MILAHKTGIRNADAVGRRLAQLDGAGRWAWNAILTGWNAARELARDEELELPSIGEIAKLVRARKPAWWDSSVDWEPFDTARQNLQAAYRWFVDCQKGKHDWHPARSCGFPRMKRRRDRRTVGYRSHVADGKRVRWLDQRHPVLPGVGPITLAEPLPVPGWVKEVHCVREGGKWYAVLVYENGRQHPTPPDELGHVIGTDVGLTDLVVTSNGEVYENPRYFRSTEKKLRKINKAISRSVKLNHNVRTNRRARLYAKRGRLQGKQANQRRTHTREVASAIAKSCDTLVVESLNVKGMAKSNLAKSVSDAGMGGLLRELAWQCQKRGKNLLEASRWFPSTQLCARCSGRPKTKLTLSDRQYGCQHCGWDCDRDLNAAINLKNVAPALWATLKGHGENVRPAGALPQRAGLVEVSMGAVESAQVRLIPA